MEAMTGGIIVWRSGSSMLLYRGLNYELVVQESNDSIAYNGLGNGREALLRMTS